MDAWGFCVDDHRLIHSFWSIFKAGPLYQNCQIYLCVEGSPPLWGLFFSLFKQNIWKGKGFWKLTKKIKDLKRSNIPTGYLWLIRIQAAVLFIKWVTKWSFSVWHSLLLLRLCHIKTFSLQPLNKIYFQVRHTSHWKGRNAAEMKEGPKLSYIHFQTWYGNLFTRTGLKTNDKYLLSKINATSHLEVISEVIIY